MLLSKESLLRKYFRFFSPLASSQEFGAHEYSGLFFILCSWTPLSVSWDRSSPGGWKMDQKDVLSRSQSPETLPVHLQKITEFGALQEAQEPAASATCLVHVQVASES